MSKQFLTFFVRWCVTAALCGMVATTGRAQTLPLPANLSYSGGEPAFKVTNKGNGRAIVGQTNSTTSTFAAMVGISHGSGAGVLGNNEGTTGPAGKFEVRLENNAQPALLATTKGTGPALQATINHDAGIDSAAVAGRNNEFSGYGYGGDFRGGFVGVYAAAANGYGLYATAPPSTGYAGYFSGNVYVAGNFTYTSDREQKTDARDLDGAQVLDRVASLPMQSWALRGQPEVRHVGPYAQDFHAAFGLGSDDTSISPVDVSGVTLVALQELNRRLARQDEELRALKAQLAELLAAKR